MTELDIVLAHYNGSKYVIEQIDSILNSTLPEDLSLKLIIIDDFSLKEELEKLVGYISAYPQIVLIRNECNMGVVRTFEKGLKLSSAPFVMLSDQDDVWLPEKIAHSLEKLVSVQGERPCLVFTDLEIVDARLYRLHGSMIKRYGFQTGRILHSILTQNIVTGCTVIMNRELINFATPFPDKIIMHDYWLALCASYSGNIEFLPEVTMKYRQHGANLIGAPRNNPIGILINIKRFSRAYFSDLRATLKQIYLLQERLKERNFSEVATFISGVNKAFETPGLKSCRYLLRLGVLRFNIKSLLIIFLVTFKSNSRND